MSEVAATCGRCGHASRGWPLGVLLLLPVAVGAIAAIFVSLTKGRLAGTTIALAVSLGFLGLLALLARQALALIGKRACARCGADLRG